MRENKTYSSQYVACSESMFETGGAGVNWRTASKTCQFLRGGAMPIGKGSDTFLKFSEIFVASRLDPKRKSSRIAERVIPSAIYLKETFLPVRLRPDFSVLLNSYEGGAVHRHRCDEGPKHLYRLIFCGPVSCVDPVNFLQGCENKTCLAIWLNASTRVALTRRDRGRIFHLHGSCQSGAGTSAVNGVFSMFLPFKRSSYDAAAKSEGVGNMRHGREVNFPRSCGN